MASTSPRRSRDPSSPSSPLLPPPSSPGGGGGGALGRLSGLRGAARFIRRTGSRRLMREPSVAVRETAAEHLEERQTDWAYSKPVVVLDVLWNLAFVAVAAAVLAASLTEQPSVPLRAWLAGYVVQCLLHVLCVAVEYKRRQEATARGSGIDQEGAVDGDFKLSVVKHLESANTMFSFIWWIIGFYWVSAGGQALSHDAPQLYWLTIVFLAFDVFFVVFCVALACVIGIAVCCCLPCIIAILYAVTDQQEGASEEDINNLSKYKFRTMGDADKLVAGIAAPVGGVMTECGTSPPVEHILSAEDAMKRSFSSPLVVRYNRGLYFSRSNRCDGDAVARCDDTSRVVVPLHTKGVPYVGFHEKTSRGVKYHTFEEIKVGYNNAMATSSEARSDDIVPLMDVNPKNATPQVVKALPTVDMGVAHLDPTSEPTNNFVAAMVTRRLSHQEMKGCCVDTCIAWDTTSYLEAKCCHHSYEHNCMNDMPQLMILTGHDEGASLPTGCRMKILVHLGGQPLTALVDSGATHNVIGLDVANQIGLRVSRARVHVTLANGTCMESNGVCRNIRLSIGSDIFALSSYVVHSLDIDVILGAPWLESLGDITCNFSKRVMRFKYNDHEVELHGLMDDVVEDATMPKSLSPLPMALFKIDLPKTGLFNDIRREVRSEPELAAMLYGIQKGDRGNPWGVIDGIIFYNQRLYIPLWSPILAQVLNGVHQFGGFALLDEIAIGIHKPSSSPFTRSFPTSILLPQAIPQKSIQTCNVILADYVGTEFLRVSGVIWQRPSVFMGPSRLFLDDSAVHTFFGMCINHVNGQDRIHTTSSPTFLTFVNVFCRESKCCPFFAFPPSEATTFNYVWIESKEIMLPWVAIPSRSSYFQPRNRFVLKGQIGTLGFQLQLTIYGDTSNIYEHIQIGELRTLLWAVDYSMKFQGRSLIGNQQLEDELCHNKDDLCKETGRAEAPSFHVFPAGNLHSL